MPQPERRLPGVHAGAEQLELKDRLQLPKLRWNLALYAQPALPYTGEPTSIFPKFVLEGRKLARADHVEPVRINLPCLKARVQHGEAVDVEAGFSIGAGRIILRPDWRRTGEYLDRCNHKY